MVNVSPRHIWVPQPNIILGFVGLETDVRSLSHKLKIQLTATRNRALGFGTDLASRRLTPAALAHLTSHVLYRKRGYYVEPIVVGLMEKTYQPFLCSMDMIGALSFSKQFVVSGAASKSLYGTAEALWRKGLEANELVEVCGKAFQSALERDCYSGYGILVYLITKDGIVEYDIVSRNDWWRKTVYYSVAIFGILYSQMQGIRLRYKSGYELPHNEYQFYFLFYHFVFNSIDYCIRHRLCGSVYRRIGLKELPDCFFLERDACCFANHCGLGRFLAMNLFSIRCITSS